MATARELSWKLGWQINDSPISNADKKTDELGKKVTKVGKETESLDKKAKVGFGGMFSAIKQGIGIFAGFNIGSQITNAFTGGIKAGWNFNSSMEQSTAAFETMLGTTEKAKNMLGDLSQFAAKTPFELGDLTKASQTMLAFGIDAQKVMPNIQMLGDVSLGNKQKFDSMTLAFSQIQATGRLMGQDLLQLVNAGFNPLQEISQKTGLSLAELKKAMEDGQISADMVTQAFKDATSEGGRFFGGMDRQSKTFEGQMSTLSDNVKMTLGQVMSPAFEHIKKNVLPGVIDKVQIFSDAFKDSGSIITGVLSVIKNSFSESTSRKISDSIMIIKEGFNLIGGFIKGDFSGTGLFSMLGINEGDESQIYKTLLNVRSAIAENIGFISTKVIEIFDSLGPPIMNFVKSIMPVVGKAFDTLVNTIYPAVRRIQGNLVDFLIPQLKKAFDFLRTTILPPVINIFNFLADTIIPKILSIVQEVMPDVQSLFGKTFDLILKAVGYVVSNFEIVWPYISDIISITVDHIGQVIKGLVKILDGIIDFIAGVFTGEWGKAWEGVKNIFGGIFDILGSMVKSSINSVIAIINHMIRGIGEIKISIPDWSPVLPGKSIGFSIPEIPMLKKGGTVLDAGSYIAGEEGPELISGTPGATVIPNRQTQRILSGSSGDTYSPNIMVHVKVTGGSNPAETGNAVASATKQAVSDAIEEFFYNLSLKNTATVER